MAKASPLEISEICVAPFGNSTFFVDNLWIFYMYIPSAEENNVRNVRKLNVGNYLVYDISRAFFYIAYKGKIYFFNSK